MKKLLFGLILLFGVFGIFHTPQANAACSTSPVFSVNSYVEGDVYVTWSLKFRNNCASSYQYNFTGAVPSGWDFKFSGCTTNDTTCWKSVPGGGSINVSFTVTRPVTATTGTKTVTAKGYPSSGAGDSIGLTYNVIQLPNCNTGATNCTACSYNSGTCGSGTQTCTHNTRSDGKKCFPVKFTRSCSKACPTNTPTPTPKPPTPTPTPKTTYECVNYTCTSTTNGSGYDTLSQCQNNCQPPPPPPCDSKLADLAPAGIPVGGLCMVNRMIQLGLNLLLIASIILAIFYLIWGGATWILSEGDKQKLSQARQRITLAVIGLVIVFVSFAVLKILQLLFKIG